MFDADKTRMIGLPYGEKDYDNILSRFHVIPERHGQTDEQTDRQPAGHNHYTSRVSVLTRDKSRCNSVKITEKITSSRCFLIEDEVLVDQRHFQ